MKNRTLLAAVVVCALLALGATQVPRGEVGRFQVVQGRWQSKNGVTGEHFDWVILVRVDTVTGETHEYTATVGGPGQGIGWKRMQDF